MLWKGDACDERYEVDTCDLAQINVECYPICLDNEIDVMLCRYHKVLHDTKPYH